MEIQSTPNRLEEHSCPGALETLSVNDLVALILDVDSAAEIRHVLVFCKGSSAPLRRIEIRLTDQKQIPRRIGTLAAALERSGFANRAVQDRDLAADEIWLTLPHSGTTALLSWGSHYRSLPVRDRAGMREFPPALE
jgi:hypothetical protein